MDPLFLIGWMDGEEDEEEKVSSIFESQSPLSSNSFKMDDTKLEIIRKVNETEQSYHRG